MDAALIARIMLSRLRLPIPAAKLTVLHAAAEALQDMEQGNIFWAALLEWVAELELESEVIEALCIAVLAKHTEPIDVSALQQAIRCPSPLSDIYLRAISGSPSLVNSWAKSHSIEVSPLFSAGAILEQLTNGIIVPPALANRLEILEKESGYPFLKQWAYEFQRLIASFGAQSDGHWQYFVENEHDRCVARLITRRSHLARSAYLRTLALAFDLWAMPEARAYREAMYATPADLTFLRMLPSEPPSWLEPSLNKEPESEAEWQKFLYDIIDEVSKTEVFPELLYLNVPLSSTATYQAEVEVISCVHHAHKLEPEDVFDIHRALIGQIDLPRTNDWNIIVKQQVPDGPIACRRGGNLYPALFPCPPQYGGYLHTDLMGRMPCLPANYFGPTALLAQPRLGGMDILLGSRQIIGEVKYWNWQWSPTHDKALGPHCGVSLAVSKDCCKELLAIPDVTFSRYWRATVLTREKEYGNWEEKTLVCALP